MSSISIKTVADYLTDRSEEVAIHIVDDIMQKLEIEFPKEELKYYYNVYTEFIRLLAESITYSENRIPKDFMEMSKKNGERQAALKGRISSIIGHYPEIRLGFIEQITKISVEHGLSAAEAVTVNKRLNYMLDTSVTETIYAFERLTDRIIVEREREIDEKQKAINELSAPIVPIQDGIAILPLIGTIDSERVQHILNKVLPDIPRLAIECLIIDFSGIVTIDSEVASHLFRIHDILHLLGINVNFTGIRPDLAAKTISGGINFSSIKTYSTVKQAIESINESAKLN